MAEVIRSKTRVKGFEDAEMDFQLIRQLGTSFSGGASVGECLAIASRITQGSPESWVEEFEKMARSQQEDANRRLKKGHTISARKLLLKACNSFRAAEYYSPCGVEHHQQLGKRSRECFHLAMNLSDYHFEALKLPYQNIMLPCYFIAPDDSGKKRKTIMIVSGFDGTLEEEFLFRGIEACERDYNVVLFAGPGQMDVFRDYSDTYFEPDYEKPTSKVIDYLSERADVDLQQLALMGISFGGYFAIRAAVNDRRIKALIANSPILDLHAYMSAFTGMVPDVDIPDQEDFSIDDLDSIPEQEMTEQMKAQSEHLMRRFGGHSFKKTYTYLRQFSVGEKISLLECPCLALVGSGEGGEPLRQFEEFCQKTRADQHFFSAFEGADTHCQVGNAPFANAVVYDWLDEQFK